jgi:UDP-glucuronate decarboxylase
MTNIADLIGHPRFQLVTHDIVTPLDLHADEIYNLACPASPVHYQFDPVHTIKTSVYGAINMLDLAKRLKARILQASTSEVYGDPETHPQAESYKGSVNCFGPRACYDEGKRCAEALCYAYAHEHGVSVRVARIFNTYGPGMHPDDGRVVSNFIVQALTDRPITVYGDGQQTRSFCYVDDLVAGLVRLMQEHRGSAQLINLGNPAEITVLELADLVRKLAGSRSEIVHKPLPVDDPCRRRPDLTCAYQILGWQPSVPLQTGLTRTIEYFDRYLSEKTRNARLYIAR